jgi:hypothetical protein
VRPPTARTTCRRRQGMAAAGIMRENSTQQICLFHCPCAYMDACI